MGGFFSPKQTQSTIPTRLNSIQINQSAFGNCIPLLYGTDRLPMTLIDYVDFVSTPTSQQQGGKGGGSKTASGYTYSASLSAMLCEGPVSAISAVFNNQSVTTLAAAGFTLFTGAGGQAPWSYMTQHHLDHALPYDHTAYVAAPNLSLGSSAGLPNYTFEVVGLHIWTVLDSHPAEFLVDYCTDPNHGAGFPYLAPINSDHFQDYCSANSFFFSVCEQQQRSATDFIAEVLQATNSNCVWSPGVGLRFVPYGDDTITGNGVTYTPNLVPIYEFFDEDYAKDDTGTSAPVTVSILPANQTFNCWRVEFIDRSNQYNVGIAEYRDELDIATNGLRVQAAVSLHMVKNRAVAHLIATLLCNRNLYIRNTFTFKVRADFCLLEPMDLVSINDTRVGIVDQLVRITDITDNADDTLEITAEEMVVGPAAAPLYNNQLAQAYAQNFLGDPGPVAKPYIFTFPPALADPAANGYELGIAVGGAGGEWGGAEVWLSLDNATYWRVGTVDAPSRYGTLTQPLPAGNDPDTTSILSVQLNTASPLTMVSGTRSAADTLLTPCIVDGEIISYQTVQAQGNNAYALSYLRRAKYGSTAALHNAGSAFAVIDQDIFRMKFDPGYAGLPFWVKFISFNIFGGGPRTLANEVAYQGFFQGQNGGVLESAGAVPLYARGTAAVVGNRIFKMSNGNAAWDSDVYSQDAFSGGCVARAICKTPALYGMFGLNSDPLTDTNYTSLDYAWYCAVSGYLIYESGNLVSTIPIPISDTTLLEVRYDGKFITYLADNVIWRTVAAPNKSLYFDCSLHTPNFVFDNVYFGLLNPATTSPFVARNGCVVSDENVTKTGFSDIWDADVYSLEGYQTAHVSWKVSQAFGKAIMIGLGTRPAQDTSYTSINYAIYTTETATVQIYESGTRISIGDPTFGTKDIFAVTYDGTTITYLMNGRTLRTVSAPGLTVYMDSSFRDPQGGVNTLQYGPGTALQLSDTGQIGGNAATEVHIGTTTIGTQTIPSGFGNDVQIVVVNMAPPAFDATVIMTGTIAQLKDNSGFNNNSHVIGLYEVLNGSGTVVAATTGGTRVLIQGTSTDTAIQWQFNHLASSVINSGGVNARLSFLFVNLTSFGTVTISGADSSVQGEYIKK